MVEATSGLPNGADFWNTVDLTNQPGPNSWPLATFSYALFYKNLTYLGANGAMPIRQNPATPLLKPCTEI